MPLASCFFSSSPALRFCQMQRRRRPVEACVWAHLAVAFPAAALAVVSAHGHAQQPGLPWMHVDAVVTRSLPRLTLLPRPSSLSVIGIGSSRHHALPDRWRVPAPIPPTVAQTAVARALKANAPVQASSMRSFSAFPVMVLLFFSSIVALPLLLSRLHSGLVSVQVFPGPAAL